MLYIDEDYKIKMADTARETTQEQIQKGEIGLWLRSLSIQMVEIHIYSVGDIGNTASNLLMFKHLEWNWTWTCFILDSWKYRNLWSFPYLDNAIFWPSKLKRVLFLAKPITLFLYSVVSNSKTIAKLEGMVNKMFDLTYQKRQFCKPIKDELFRPLVVSPILCAICQVLSLHLILKGKVQFRFNINIDKDFILTRSAPSSGILREISPHLGAAWVKIKVLSMFIFHCDSPLVALIIIFKTDINGKPKYKKWICIGTLMGISTVITVYTLVKRLLRTGFWFIHMSHK